MLLYLYGDIGYDVEAAEFVSQLDGLPQNEPVTVRISSAGGEVFQGFTMANRLRALPNPVTVEIDGLAASMATVIALAADRVLMARDAWFMIHNPAAVFAAGEADDLRRQADRMDSVADQMVEIYATRTGAPAADIRAAMDAETWYTAEQALAIGFVDEITPARQVLAAQADLLKLGRFGRAPLTLGGFKPMKTKLAILLTNRIGEIATDKTAESSLVRAIASAAGTEEAIVQMIVDGNALIAPTPEVLEACANVLSLEVQAVRTEALADFPGLAEALDAGDAGDPAPAAPTGGAHSAAVAHAAGRDAEARRRNEIAALFAQHPGHDDLLEQMVGDPRMTVEAASTRLLTALGNASQGPLMGGGHAPARVSEDRRDKFIVGVTEALMCKAHGSYRKAHRDAFARNEFKGYTLTELARVSLEIAGHNTHGMDRLEMVGQSFTSSDLPHLMADVANKSMMVGFEEAAESWDRIARVGNLADFKPHKRTTLSEFDDLLKITGGAEEYKRGEFTDVGEFIVADTYGRLFAITRQTLINDDLGAFTETPMKMGRAANRKVGDIFWTLWIAGQTMNETGANTWDAAEHNNDGAGVLDSANVDLAAAAMATQPGPLAKDKGDGSGADHGLNIVPAYLVVPRAQRGRGLSVVQSEWEYDDANPDSRRPNVAQGVAEVVWDARLDQDSALKWYLSADPNQQPTIEMGFLDGSAAPRLEQQEQFTTDGVTYKVSIDCGAAWLGWRGVQRRSGAA